MEGIQGGPGTSHKFQPLPPGNGATYHRGLSPVCRGKNYNGRPGKRDGEWRAIRKFVVRTGTWIVFEWSQLPVYKRIRMIYQTYPPSEKIKDYVRYYWTLESNEPYTHYSMADACPELLFHYSGLFDELYDNGKKEKSFTAGVHGQTHFTRKFYIDKGFGIFGVYLFPHAITHIFGIPANVISNEMPDLNDLLGSEANELEFKIANARCHDQRRVIIEDFIAQKRSSITQEKLPVFRCIRTIIKNKGQTKVKQMAKDCFLSERQFERQFLKYSGFTPKMFSRIVRFQSAMTHYGKREKSLTEIALETGYYDQSHFIHDFKEFSGHLPSEYFSGNSKATEWKE